MSFMIGVVLNLLSGLFGFLGKISIKKSHQLATAPHSTTAGQRLHRAVYFVLGLVSIILLNPFFSVVAYHYAAQSILAPMAGLGVIWNSTLTPTLCHEAIQPHDWLGACLIFLGCVLGCVLGPHAVQDISLATLGQIFDTVRFAAYVGALACLVTALVTTAWPVFLNLASNGKSHAKMDNVHGEIHTLLLHDDRRPASSRPALTRRAQMSFIALAGVMSGQMFFLKAIMRISAHDGRAIWSEGVTYVLLTGALGVALIGLVLLNLALKISDALLVIYVYESCYILAGTLSGIFIFQEILAFSFWHHLTYGASFVFILSGMYLVGNPLTFESSRSMG